MAGNKNLAKAKEAKNDEFYTQITDIENELKHYKNHFKDKVIFCNCDDPTYSNFWRYFHLKFSDLGLKKLVSTHYDPKEPTYKLEYDGGDDSNIEAGNKTPLTQNGDFRSPECIELLKEADIVITNPPFSLFREYVAQLMEYGKKFIIIGNMNAIAYKEFFPLIKDNKVWMGYSSPKKFIQPNGETKNFGNIYWYTNLDHKKRHEPLTLFRSYATEPERFPKYDNYDAINVEKTVDIPCDYYGYIGVPISFLNKYSPDQFELIDNDLNPTNSVDLDNRKKKSGRFYVKRERERAIIFADYCSQKDLIKLLHDQYGYTDNELDVCSGVMGVPISFMDKYCPDQFEILECHEPAISLKVLQKNPKFVEHKSRQIVVNNVLCQKQYHRIFIQRRLHNNL